MMPILQLGPLALPLPPLITLAGIWVGLTFSERYASRQGLAAEQVFNLALMALISGVIGARLAYFARNPIALAAEPLALLSRDLGLFDPAGGLLIGGISAIIYAQWRKIPVWPLLDALTPALAVISVAISLSHLAAGKPYGIEAELPWSIELWGARRHPYPIYEAITSLATLWVTWPGRRLPSPQLPGTNFLRFLSLSAFFHLFLEALRGDSPLLPGGLRAIQVGAWFVLALSLYLQGKLESSTAR